MKKGHVASSLLFIITGGSSMSQMPPRNDREVLGFLFHDEKRTLYLDPQDRESVDRKGPECY